MAILGYNTKGASSTTLAAGRKFVSSFTLAAATTMTELHGWCGLGSGSQHVILLIYADDGSGSPGARVAYTSPLALTGSDVELSQSGFSVSLTAGVYWIGFVGDAGGTGHVKFDAGGSYKGRSTGATFNPPSDPFGTIDSSAVRSYSCWAVTTGAAATGGFLGFM